MAALWLGARYWVLPNVDQWRPQIARQFSAALKTDVSLGAVRAYLSGANLGLELTDVAFADRRQRVVLSLPRVRAVLSWRSLIKGVPQFLSLEVDNLDLSVRQDRKQRLWVLGRPFNLDDVATQDQDVSDSVFKWLASQRQILLRNATIRWVDARRRAPPLVLKNVTLKADNQGDQHVFSLAATPPAELGETFDLRGAFQSAALAESPEFALQSWNGQLYVRVDGMSPTAWKPWVDIPQNLDSGQVSAQAWLGIEQGRASRFTSDVSIQNAHWTFGPENSVRAGSVRLYLDGPRAAFERLFSDPAAVADAQRPVDDAPAAPLDPARVVDSGAPANTQFLFTAHALSVQVAEIFNHPLNFDEVSAQGALDRQQNRALSFAFSHAHLLNRDMDAQLAGTWRQGGSGVAGIADIRGVFERAAVSEIDEYLPTMVDLDARDWMARGLTGGQIHDARLVLRGDLEHFPFVDNPEAGDFSVRGDYTGGVIDYLPAQGKRLGWPQLSDMSGKVSLHRADLRIVADRARMWPTKESAIELSDVRAQIPDIEHESVLTIAGKTTAPADTYLALMRHSPLGGLLDNAFDKAKASGDWQVPLRLTIPLSHGNDTAVDGLIRFADSSVALTPEIPVFSHVNGILNFSDIALNVSDLKASFLGGPIAFSGGVGGQYKGLKMQGQANTAALGEYVAPAGVKRLSGKLKYRATLLREKSKRYSLTLESDLVGVGINLPEPLSKKEEQAWPLRLKWVPEGKDAVVLNIDLADKLNVALLRDRAAHSAAYFQAGTVGVNQAPPLLRSGLNVDIRYPTVDIDLWNQVIDDFSTPQAKAATARRQPLLPDLHEFRLQAGYVQLQGMEMDHVIFTAKQPQPLQWRVDISSSQTAGTLFWREAQGKVAGNIEAKFDRLALGHNAENTNSVPDSSTPDNDISRVHDYFDMPAIDLKVDKFTLYGHELGSLSVQGVNQQRGELWKLNKLNLVSPSSHIKGSGLWRLNGLDRGLTLDAQADISNLGDYSDQLGYKNVLQQGSGTVSGQVVWHNLPWAYKKTDLSGRIEVDFKKGRFNNVGSRSARLLKLLSLQSVKRLAAFKFDPASLLKDGFPFDNLRGTILVNKGIVTTDNYRVVGPLGTVVIGGNVNLSSEQLNLQAVVVPNLDVSGAAIAAGIAINPIVGIGAFLTQWLLQAPLAKAMTAQYQISGNWDDPKVKEVAHVQETGKAQPAQAGKSALPLAAELKR